MHNLKLQLIKVPVSCAKASLTVSVQLPTGSSPTKSSNRPVSGKLRRLVDNGQGLRNPLSEKPTMFTLSLLPQSLLRRMIWVPLGDANLAVISETQVWVATKVLTCTCDTIPGIEISIVETTPAGLLSGIGCGRPVASQTLQILWVSSNWHL